MRQSIFFVDYSGWDYNVDAPTVRPLGGSQSAMCYLAVELAKLGNDVTVVTGTMKPGRVLGVECASLSSPFHDRPDFVIVINAPAHSVELRRILPPTVRLVLWTQHAANQPCMHKLARPEVLDAWDDIVCVSDWQRRDIIERYGCDPQRVMVMRNAIAPAFEGLFASEAEFSDAKTGRMRLAYTSTPYRGMQFLRDVFPPYRMANPDATLDVYSSMAVYMEGEDEDRRKFSGFYDALAAVDGVSLVGSLPQPELAQRLRGSHVLAYPNAFPETSCIAVMEALAAGLRVVTSDLGALPETCEGFARLVPIDVDIDEGNASIHVKGGNAFVEAYTEALAKPYSGECLFDQVQHMNNHHTWAVRARQWADVLDA